MSNNVFFSILLESTTCLAEELCRPRSDFRKTRRTNYYIIVYHGYDNIATECSLLIGRMFVAYREAFLKKVLSLKNANSDRIWSFSTMLENRMAFVYNVKNMSVGHK